MLSSVKNKIILIKVLEMPKFMEVVFPDKTFKFKHFLERAFIHVDLSVGATGNATLKTKLYEFIDEPLKKFNDAWISGINDPETGIATYHGELKKNTMEFKPDNHTISLVITSLTEDGEIDEIIALKHLLSPSTDLQDETDDHKLVLRTLTLNGVEDKNIDTDQYHEYFKAIYTRSKKISEGIFNFPVEKLNGMENGLDVYSPLRRLD
jgi:hypothetical protein